MRLRLGTRIFLAYLAVFIVCFSYPFDRISKDLRTRYVEGIEDPLVDMANVLAELVGADMESGRFDAESFHEVFDNIYRRSLSARLYDLVKTRVDVGVYITDLSGRVIFDSKDRRNQGADYSRWRDVILTLRGQYGARTTWHDPEDLSSVVLYVAAPVIVHGKTAGVLTVAKPTTNVNTFLTIARPKIIWLGIISVAAATLLSLIISFWITGPIRRLTQYALDVKSGKRARLPRLGRSELSEMANAFDSMREALEGKKYVEQYVQTLTHEIKSPLSAIRGAAELMEEEMSSEVRARFLANVRAEANRIQDLVDRMLKLTELESKRNLEKVESIAFGALIRTVLEEKGSLLSQKGLKVGFTSGDEITVWGDTFLLHQAVSNLLQNAVDFSPVSARIDISVQQEAGMIRLVLDDEGPGIPEYAKLKVFDKFFSLQRPDTGKKSTGLGLNFVREVADLHRGAITLENRPEKGLRATLRLPRYKDLNSDMEA